MKNELQDKLVTRIEDHFSWKLPQICRNFVRDFVSGEDEAIITAWCIVDELRLGLDNRIKLEEFLHKFAQEHNIKLIE
jgi:hypothetical protein